MHQLHKILYICQLPPTLDPNPRRRLVEKFKRALFAQDSNSLNLKTEVKKVSNLFSLFQSSLNLAIPLDLNGFRDFFFPSQIIPSQEIMDLDYHWFFMKMYESMKSSPIELVKI